MESFHDWDQSDMQEWSLETGYGTEDPTPINQSIAYYRTSSFNGQFASGVFNPSPISIPTLDRVSEWNTNGTRAITKKPEMVFTQEDEDAIFNLADKLTDLVMMTASESGWCHADVGPLEEQYEHAVGMIGPEQCRQFVPVVDPLQYQESTQGMPVVEVPHCHNVPTRKGAPTSAHLPKNRSGDRRRKHKRLKPAFDFCQFCKNNDRQGWQNHQCKNNKGETVCPFLQVMQCPICGATGKEAHTKWHCPVAEANKRLFLERGLLADKDESQ